jgi:hypothetical protein
MKRKSEVEVENSGTASPSNVGTQGYDADETSLYWVAYATQRSKFDAVSGDHTSRPILGMMLDSKDRSVEDEILIDIGDAEENPVSAKELLGEVDGAEILKQLSIDALQSRRNKYYYIV